LPNCGNVLKIEFIEVFLASPHPKMSASHIALMLWLLFQNLSKAVNAVLYTVQTVTNLSKVSSRQFWVCTFEGDRGFAVLWLKCFKTIHKYALLFHQLNSYWIAQGRDIVYFITCDPVFCMIPNFRRILIPDPKTYADLWSRIPYVMPHYPEQAGLIKDSGLLFIFSEALEFMGFEHTEKSTGPAFVPTLAAYSTYCLEHPYYWGPDWYSAKFKVSP